MTSLIRKYLPDNVSFSDPGGGMFLWLTLTEEQDAIEILKQAIKMNVVFVPGANFYATKGQKSTIRLSYSNITEEEMERGMQIMGRILKEKS